MKYFSKIFIFICFFALAFKSNAEVVKKIEAKGNERVSLETLAIFGDLKLQEDYDQSDINSLIKKLYETDFFSNISAEIDSGVLTITVKENPIINSITFDGEKAKKHRDGIIEVLKLNENNPFVKNYIKSDINVLKEFYRQLGYYFVKIDAEIEKLDKNRVNVVYLIEKGDKAKISKIVFLGDKKIRDKRLRDVITSQESQFWKFLSRNIFLNKGRIELDKRLLENYYKNKGFYEVNITSTNVEYSEGEGFILNYIIDAGTRYKFTKMSANVSEALDKSAFESLEKEFDKVIGKYYSLRKLTGILQKIDTLSQLKELQFINHRVNETLIEDGIEVKIDIFEGQKFIIERINIVGNNVTNDSVIRAEMIVDEGDPFSALLLNKSVNKLKGRGIFGEVTSKITEGSSPDLKVLEISVEEKATGEISAGAGFGTDGTAFQFGVNENNWLGRGIKLISMLNVSTKTVSGNLALNNPNYNYTGNAVFLGLDVSSSDLTDTSGYKSNKSGFEVGTTFEQYEDVYLSPSLTATYEDVEVQSTASNSLQKMAGTFTNLDFGYSIIKDKRNQTFQPTEGYKTKFMQEIPLILDNSSILNGLEASKYYTHSEDIIGAFRFWGRTINGLNDEDVRIANRISIPATRLRGFQHRKVGPKDGTDYVGGNYATAIGYEAQLPNLLPEATKTDIVVFIDTANLWGVDYNGSLDDSNKIRSSIGIAANMYTTIGPLSFTFAQDLSKADSDLTEFFNFRLGTSF